MPRSDHPSPLSPGATTRRSRSRSQRQPAQRRDRVDPARRQENHCAAMAARMVEAVDRAEQVGVEQIAGAAVVAGMHRRLGRAFDDQIGFREAVEILGIADVAMNKRDTAGAQPGQRQFAAAAVKIVKGKNLAAAALRQQHSQIRADKTGPSGDQDSHFAWHPRLIVDPSRSGKPVNPLTGFCHSGTRCGKST